MNLELPKFVRVVPLLILFSLIVGCNQSDSNMTSPPTVTTTLPEPSPTPDLVTELEEVVLLDGKVQILMPLGFEPMTEELLALKYPSERRPTTVYTNRDATVNVALNHTDNQVATDELSEVHEQMGAVLRSAYPSAEWFRSELLEINGHTYFLLDFRAPAIDTEIRNIMAATELEGRLLLVTFNAIEELEEDWVPVANSVIGSMRLTN